MADASRLCVPGLGALVSGAPSALTPNTVELIPTLGALPPPRRARPGPGPHRCQTRRAQCTRNVTTANTAAREQKMLKGHLTRVINHRVY